MGVATFVLMCRDVSNNTYVRAADGRCKRYPARKVQKRNVPTKLGDLFNVMYPEIPLP